MSIASLRDLFLGRWDPNYCVKSLLLLRSPRNVEQYLLTIHPRVFPKGDNGKTRKWEEYPNKPKSVTPIKNKDLANSKFLSKQAVKLSLDITRFIEFMMGYNQVEPDIQPIMLHYSIIYLFDFFSRTWLKYDRNWGHGMSLSSNSDDLSIQIQKTGIFQRAVDAFYYIDQSSLFSLDDDDGIRYELDVAGKPKTPRIGKMKYWDEPKKKLSELIDLNQELKMTKGGVLKSNEILLGYTILFGMSSISRYRAEEWQKIRQNLDLKNKIDLILFNFLYDWIPELLNLTVIKSNIGKKAGVSATTQKTEGIDIANLSLNNYSIPKSSE